VYFFHYKKLFTNTKHLERVSRRNLLCSAAQQTYFVLQHNKLTLFCSTTNPVTISAAPWNYPYGRSDCRRCTILWSMLKVKCSLGGPQAVTFAAVTATVLLIGV